ncbi:hypothetical protein DFH09DRAFT_1089950 [Mycena vulgaris]|nr:hypothetical protein DFH09DRAFT_1089950 [Mycena vulgaris]
MLAATTSPTHHPLRRRCPLKTAEILNRTSSAAARSLPLSLADVVRGGGGREGEESPKRSGERRARDRTKAVTCGKKKKRKAKRRGRKEERGVRRRHVTRVLPRQRIPARHPRTRHRHRHRDTPPLLDECPTAARAHVYIRAPTPSQRTHEELPALHRHVFRQGTDRIHHPRTHRLPAHVPPDGPHKETPPASGTQSPCSASSRPPPSASAPTPGPRTSPAPRVFAQRKPPSAAPILARMPSPERGGHQERKRQSGPRRGNRAGKGKQKSTQGEKNEDPALSPSVHTPANPRIFRLRRRRAGSHGARRQRRRASPTVRCASAAPRKGKGRRKGSTTVRTPRARVRNRVLASFSADFRSVRSTVCTSCTLSRHHSPSDCGLLAAASHGTEPRSLAAPRRARPSWREYGVMPPRFASVNAALDTAQHGGDNHTACRVTHNDPRIRGRVCGHGMHSDKGGEQAGGAEALTWAGTRQQAGRGGGHWEVQSSVRTSEETARRAVRRPRHGNGRHFDGRATGKPVPSWRFRKSLRNGTGDGTAVTGHRGPSFFLYCLQKESGDWKPPRHYYESNISNLERVLQIDSGKDSLTQMGYA